MTSKSKAKGSGYEIEIVKELEEAGIKAVRAWGSNGKALGEHEEVDVLVTYKRMLWKETNPNDTGLVESKLKLQCKRRAKIPQFLGLSEHVDISVVREDRGQSYIVMRLSDFIERFLK